MLRAVIILMTSIFLAGCGSSRKPPADFGVLTEQFIFDYLAFSPITATSVGYHRHQGTVLDELLDDYSEPALNRQRMFLRGFKQRLEKEVDAAKLPAEDRADYDLLLRQIDWALLELDSLQSYRRNPTVYVEMIGQALFTPFMLEYAPKAERFKHIIARLEKVPELLQQARKNLVSSPEIWTDVALEQNQGNVNLIDKALRGEVPPELRNAYDKAAAAALEALEGFNAYLAKELSQRRSDWRLGKEQYARKFKLALGTDRTPEQVLAEAEAALTETRREMFRIALPVHNRMYPTHRDPVDLNLIVGETLDKIAERRSTRERYFADARRDLSEATEFVRRKQLLTLPPRDNLQVIETPEFMRGIYAVGGFNPAPALEPELGAFYWLTPIPADWSAQRIESKLREYNYYGLKLLTIHEAMPGHYVQFEYANQVQPRARRILRAVFGSGTYVEGWAVYSTELLLDEGYLDGSPELRLTFMKQQLRLIANAILDIRLHTAGMTDKEAMDLMVGRTFQENEEATAKLRRAKLSSCQLSTYYVGWRDWLRLRDHYRTAKAENFRLAEFHESSLKAGALSLPALSRLLTGEPFPTN